MVWYGIVVSCGVLYCIVSRCIVLYCLYCIVLYCIQQQQLLLLLQGATKHRGDVVRYSRFDKDQEAEFQDLEMMDILKTSTKNRP